MEEVKAHASNPIYAVDLKISNTCVQHKYIEAFVKHLLQVRTVEDLHQGLVRAMQGFHTLGVFRSSNIAIMPGPFEDTASVEIALVDSPSWDTRLAFSDDFEGGSTEFTWFLRNLRKKADLTSLRLQYRHNTGSKGYAIDHIDQMFRPGKLLANWSFMKTTRELDQNVLEHISGAEFGIQSFDHSHKLDFGRHVRQNLIAVQYASLALLEELPVSSKNFVAYSYNASSIDNEDEPTQGYSFQLRNEFALGETIFHKCELKASYFRSLIDYITLETSVNAGWILPWSFTKVHTNDRFRCRYIKGFTSAGERVASPEPKLAGKFQVPGDDLGSNGYACMETKLHLYETPFLVYAGITPFLYANLILVNPTLQSAEQLRATMRGSVGFGATWNLLFGKVEFAYASKVWSKPGDVPAEFSVRYSL